MQPAALVRQVSQEAPDLPDRRALQDRKDLLVRLEPLVLPDEGYQPGEHPDRYWLK